MMGRQTGNQSQLFYLFNLERRILAWQTSAAECLQQTKSLFAENHEPFSTPSTHCGHKLGRNPAAQRAHLKIYHGFERMRLRGLSGARDEFLLAATVQNLKTLALRLLGHHSPGGAHRLPEIAHASVSRVRVEVAANQAATKPNSRLISAGSKPLTGITPTGKPTF